MGMPHIRLQRKSRSFCLACAVGALLALPAAGQEADLRGTVSETRNAGIPSPVYQPASAGALPAETGENGTLFPDRGADADQTPFSSLDSQGPPRTPSTARERRADRARQAADAPAEREAPETGAVEATSTASLDGGAEAIRPLPLRTNAPVQPIEGRRPTREDDPYAPLGLRVGSFTVVPTLEQGLRWTSNANDSPQGSEALFSETTLRLNAVSDWPRHRAALNGYATYRETISGEQDSELEGGADAALELDLADGLSARAALSYEVRRETASSPVFVAGVERQPLRHTLDGALGVERALGRLRLGVTGAVTRDWYGDARLANGDTLSQSDRNSTLAVMRLRGGYELSPALIPFLEVEAGRRFHDEDRDSAGYARSATRLAGRAGLALDLTEKLAGEVSAGWVAEDFEDSRLDTVSGLELAAALDWSPMRGTNVRLDGTTTVEGSTNAGESGSLLYAGTLRIERRLRANLSGDVALGAAWRDYAGDGHDLILSGEASLTWWLNRYAGLTGRARHERQHSSLPDRDYEETSVFMGVTLQR